MQSEPSVEPFIESSVLDDDILVVRLSGRLDNQTAEQFEDEISKYLDKGVSKVIVDASRLGFINSHGIGLLVTLQMRLRRHGGEVKLSGLQGPVADVIKLVRLTKLLDIHGDVEFARESFEN